MKLLQLPFKILLCLLISLFSWDRRAYLRFLFCCAWILSTPLITQAINVRLTVHERAGITRDNEPVVYGVPLASTDNITSTANLGIFSSNELPAQFRVLSRYGGLPSDTDKPIRMLLCDVQVNLPASDSLTLYLKDTGSGTAAGSNIASETNDHVILSTDSMTMKIRKTGYFNMFDEVWIDTTGDGDVDSQVVSSNSTDGILVHANGKTYSSSNAAPTSITIEENGPLRAVVKVRGYYTDSSGNFLVPSQGDVGLEYMVRIVAYKKKSFVRIFHTMMSENFGWATSSSFPAHNVDIDWAKIMTTMNLNSSKTVQFQQYSDSFSTGNYELLQEHMENQQDESGNFRFTITKDGSTVQTGTRYDSFADLRDSSKGLMVASRWFWQNWPKGIAVSDNTMNFFLWPDMSADHVFIGSHYKTHEMIYNFHGTIPGSYDFSTEMSSLRKRPILLASDTYYASTNFIDFIPPAQVSTDYTFTGGEKLQTAIDAWNASIRAKFNSSYSTNSNYKYSFFDLREARPFTWSYGVFSGQRINWYGWLDFGDFPREGNYGFPAIHYNWAYIALIHGIRFGDYDMLEIGDQMARHKADIDIIHDPNGVDSSPGFSEDWYRGGHRYEHDAHYQLGNWKHTISEHFDPHTGAHSWIKGLILQYLLTGENYYFEVLQQVGDHWKHNFDENTKSGRDCGAGPCWDVGETRQVTRVINMVTDLWKLFGDTSYLTLAANIFNNSIIANLEVEKSGVPQGYLYYPTAQSDCCGQTCDAHMFYEAIATKSFINLYYELANNNRTGDANAVRDHLTRKANWFKDSVYTNYQQANCGTYGTGADSGKYFPYIVKTDWKENCPWDGSSGVNDSSYSIVQADLFAFMHKMTDDQSWLDLARSVFKDGFLYSNHAEFQTINQSTSLGINSFPLSISSAWLKEGKIRHKPMYYLYIESRVNETPQITEVKFQTQ